MRTHAHDREAVRGDRSLGRIPETLSAEGAGRLKKKRGPKAFRAEGGHWSVPEIKPAVVERSLKVLSPLVKTYFRSEVRGLERVPREQTLVVTHHDGGMIPVNGICFGVAWYEHFGTDRPMYVLTHDLIHSMWPAFNRLMRDSGLVPADRGMADATLASGHSLLVFPGAARESYRTFKDRRDIDLGGRTGFVSQAIRWGVPITPVVSAGSHETVIVLSRGTKLAKKLGIPKIVRSADVLPLQVGLPWGIWALPLLPPLPLPARITTEVLEPVWLPDALGRDLSPDDADDPEIVRAGYELVIGRMRKRLAELYDERRWPVIG